MEQGKIGTLAKVDSKECREAAEQWNIGAVNQEHSKGGEERQQNSGSGTVNQVHSKECRGSGTVEDWDSVQGGAAEQWNIGAVN